MGLFKKISSFFTFTNDKDELGYHIQVRCSRCGEIIESRIDLKNDLSTYYGDADVSITSEKEPHYFCRKTLIGKERCFQRIEVEMIFDQHRNIIDRQIVGGEFVSESETNQE